MALSEFILDRTWAQNALMAQSYQQSRQAKNAATFSPVETTFVTTRIGGNVCINPLPQFTRSADIRRAGVTTIGNGMGRYYYEAFQRHYQIINIRLGVPAFNSLAMFLTNNYNTKLGRLARTGEGPSWLYRVGEAAGFVVNIMSWKIQLVRLVGQAYAFFAEKGSSKFYTVKPTMPLYWNAVQSIVNQMAVNYGIVPRLGGDAQRFKDAPSYEYPPGMIKQLRNYAPRIFHSSGSIDVYAIATQAQRNARAYMKRLEAATDAEMSIADTLRYVNESKLTGGDIPAADYTNYLNRWLSTNQSGSQESIRNTIEVDGVTIEEGINDFSTIESLRDATSGDRLSDFLNAELDDGGAFVSFRVNHTGSVSDSFSNATGDSELGNTLNNLTSSRRNLAFTLANGNVSEMVSGVLGGVKSVIEGTLDTVGLGGVSNLIFGGAFTDIPSMWKSSSARVGQSSYTIQLVSPYNHPYAKLLYVDIPFAMLLAMALPLSTGKQSYTSPFILEYYDQGRSQSRLAIVDSLSVTRGSTSLAFSRDKRALGIDVTLNFAHLDNIVHMPISQGLGLTDTIISTIANPIGAITGSSIFDDDSPYTDYLASVCGLGLSDQIYRFRKLKLNLTREMLKWESWTSPARIMNALGDSWPGRIANTFYAGTVRN